MAHDHRAGHDVGHAPGPAVALDDAELEALLFAAVLRGHSVDTEREQRAVAAFRAARDAGAHRARTRRRDDWRPRAQRRPGRSVKAALSLFVASLTLGGVAFAAIGSSDAPDASSGDQDRPTPAADASDGPAGTSSAPAFGKPGRPATAQDIEAKCRAYEQVGDRGQALDSTAWQRLVKEAGSAEKVAAYCAERLAAAREEQDEKGAESGPPDNAQDPSARNDSGQSQSGAGQGESGQSGSGQSGSGQAESGAETGAESGQAGSGQADSGQSGADQGGAGQSQGGSGDSAEKKG